MLIFAQMLVESHHPSGAADLDERLREVHAAAIVEARAHEDEERVRRRPLGVALHRLIHLHHALGDGRREITLAHRHKVKRTM